MVMGWKLSVSTYRFQALTYFYGITEKGENADEEKLGHFPLMAEGFLSGPRRGKAWRLERMVLPQLGVDGDVGFGGQVFLSTNLDAVAIVCLWESHQTFCNLGFVLYKKK